MLDPVWHGPAPCKEPKEQRNNRQRQTGIALCALTASVLSTAARGDSAHQKGSKRVSHSEGGKLPDRKKRRLISVCEALAQGRDPCSPTRVTPGPLLLQLCSEHGSPRVLLPSPQRGHPAETELLKQSRGTNDGLSTPRSSSPAVLQPVLCASCGAWTRSVPCSCAPACQPRTLPPRHSLWLSCPSACAPVLRQSTDTLPQCHRRLLAPYLLLSREPAAGTNK